MVWLAGMPTESGVTQVTAWALAVQVKPSPEEDET